MFFFRAGNLSRKGRVGSQNVAASVYLIPQQPSLVVTIELFHSRPTRLSFWICQYHFYESFGQTASCVIPLAKVSKWGRSSTSEWHRGRAIYCWEGGGNGMSVYRLHLSQESCRHSSVGTSSHSPNVIERQLKWR